MLYDRPYMRQSAGFQRNIPMFGWILIVLGVVFLLQNILQLFFGMDGLLNARGGAVGGLLPNWFALSDGNLEHFRIWTLLTYSLFHGSLFHLLANGLIIFFIGRMVEIRLGAELLLKLYLFAAFLGGVAWALVNWGGSGGIVIGASAGALGLLIYFCLRNPNEPITLLLFFVIPVTVLPKWIAWGVLGLETFGLLFSEIGSSRELFGEAKLAHSAHLGGMAAAFLFFRYENWFRAFSLPKVRLGKREGKESVSPRYKVNVSGAAKTKSTPTRSTKKKTNLREEVDRILDKINSSGFGSLSEEEKETLNRAKELLGK